MAWGPELLVGLVAVACYVNTLANDYCYDDIPIVARNPSVVAPGRWGAVWTQDYWAHEADEAPARDLLYRPVTISSLRLVRQFAGPSPFPQRLVNVVLHALVSVLVVRLARRLSVPPQTPNSHRLEAGATQVLGRTLWLGGWGGMVAGLVFAVLPIHTEVIASVVGRSDLLGAMGVVACLLCHHRWIEGSGKLWLLSAAIWAFVAFGAKESAIGLVALVLVFDLCFAHENQRKANWHRRLGWSILRSAYVLVPAIAYLALRYMALGGQLHQRPAVSKTVNVLVDAPPWQHVLGALQLWGMYWAKTIWPSVLTIGYSINSIRLATHWWDVHVLIGSAMLLLLGCVVVLAWRRGWYQPVFLLIGLLLAYLPTSNALVLIQVFFAERIWYLPSVFACLLVGWAIGRVRGKNWRFVAGIVGVAAVAMFARSVVRNGEWRNNGTLYAAAFRDEPNSIAALHLYGLWLVSQGRTNEGIGLLRKAVEIDLGFTDAHRALGQAYLTMGDLNRAVYHLQTANMQVPNHEPTVRALNTARTALSDRHEGEVAELIRSVEAAPTELSPRLALIRRLRDLGRVDDALREFLKADAQLGSDATWQSEYAVTLVMANRVDQAIDRYHRVLALRPDDVAAMVELAMLLLERRAIGDLAEATDLSARAAVLAPGQPLVLACEAEVRALKGDAAGAIDCYRLAAERLPPGSELRRIYEQRSKALGGR